MLWHHRRSSGWRFVAGVGVADEHALRSVLVCLAVAGLCWRRGRALVRCCRLCWSLRPMCCRRPWAPATCLPELFAADDRRGGDSTSGRPHCATVSTILLLPPTSITEVRQRGDPRSARSSMRPCLTSWSEMGPTDPLRSFRRSGAVACRRATGGSNRTRVVATGGHRALPHLPRRIPQPDTYKMARRQCRLICSRLRRTVRLVGA